MRAGHISNSLNMETPVSDTTHPKGSVIPLCFILTQSHKHRPAAVNTHQMCINPLVKIVPQKCTISSRLRNIC